MTFSSLKEPSGLLENQKGYETDTLLTALRRQPENEKKKKKAQRSNWALLFLGITSCFKYKFLHMHLH